MSGATAAAAPSSSSAGSCSHRFCPGSCSTGRRGCRVVAVRRRCSPTGSCAACGGKSTVSVEGTTLVYRLALPRPPPGSLRPSCSSPSRSARPRSGVGLADALALLGLLALARFALAAASWDVANGFSMGASRELTISAFVEATLVLSLAVSALVAGTTDLRGVIAGTAPKCGRARRSRRGGRVRARRGRGTGRQLADNPDTHLERTMIHEGPLLEVRAATSLYLQWAASARHRLVLVLAAQVFLASSGRAVAAARLAAAPARRHVRGARPDRDARGQDADPARSATALDRCGRGAARRRRLARGGNVSGAITWMLAALGLGVVVVRRRSVAVALVSVQAFVLAAVAAAEASSGDEVVTAAALAARAAGLAVLLLFVVARTRELRPVRAGRPARARGPAVALALTLIWLVPPVGLESSDAERAALALVAFGLITAATRRATLLQVVGIVLVENALALAALESSWHPHRFP